MATDELSAEEIHKLKQFSQALPDEQDKLDQLKNVDIDAIVDATGVSRRNVLQVILGLAAGGVVGGLSANEIVQAVEADASTTDSDGNVGLPGDRVDVYADGIDSNSLSADDSITKNTPLIDPRHPDYGADSSASDNSAALQAALDDTNQANNGAVIIAENFDYSTTLEVPKSGAIIGVNPKTALTYTGSGDAVELTDSWATLYNFGLIGNSNASRGIYRPDNANSGQKQTLQRLWISGFSNGTGIDIRKAWQSEIRNVQVRNNQKGILLETSGADVTLLDVTASNNTDEGLNVTATSGGNNATGIRVVGGDYSNNNTGIKVSDSDSFVMANPWMESNSSRGVFMNKVDNFEVSIAGSDASEGYLIYNSAHGIVYGPARYDCSSHAIQVGSSSNTCEDVTIVGPVNNTGGTDVSGSSAGTNLYHYDETGGTAL